MTRRVPSDDPRIERVALVYEAEARRLRRAAGRLAKGTVMERRRVHVIRKRADNWTYAARMLREMGVPVKCRRWAMVAQSKEAS